LALPPVAAPSASGWSNSCRVEITPSPLGDAPFSRRTREMAASYMAAQASGSAKSGRRFTGKP
ncbi:hypothetical protein, partial [Verrucomicrobium sp. 3C]|uniref:hypothetical protein n=1 Tax=Verrucomicrobium sp. 3C TaxID=1134055 RepID=UPI001E641E34